MPKPDRQRPRWRWVGRLALMVGVPLMVLGGIEGGLKLAGYGFPTDFLVPEEQPGIYTTNERFLQRFYPHRESFRGMPFKLTQGKPTNTFRIFIVGESAALGTPNPAFGFGRILESMLTEAPGKRFEVYNAAMRGVNSHILLPVARDCARFQPDLFVIYMGHNELVGLHGAKPVAGFVDRHLPLIRLSHWSRGTRLGQLIQSALRRETPDEQDMAFFRAHRIPLDDPRRAHVYSHFRTNLEDMLRAVRSAGAQVLLCTVPSNLGDSPPVGSIDEPRCEDTQKAEWNSAYAAGVVALKASRFHEAAALLERALKIDAHSANLHYRLGQACAGLTNLDQALRHYQLARDWDALALRADSRLNQIIRDTSERPSDPGVVLVDIEKLFEHGSTGEQVIPGRHLFSDHVHLRFEGDYRVAQALDSGAFDLPGKPFGERSQALMTQQECAQRLAYNDWEDLEIQMAAFQQFSRPPFLDTIDHEEIAASLADEVKRRQARFTAADLRRIRRGYENAIAQRPKDWQVRLNFGVFLMVTGDPAGAVKHLEEPVRLFPAHTPFRIRLADALAHAGRKEEAIVQLRQALYRNPDSRVAVEGLRALGTAKR